MFYWGMEASWPVWFCGTCKDNRRQVALQISRLLSLNYIFQCDRRREVITSWILFELAAQLQVQNIEVGEYQVRELSFASVEPCWVPPEIPLPEDPCWLLRTVLEQRLMMDSWGLFYAENIKEFPVCPLLRREAEEQPFRIKKLQSSETGWGQEWWLWGKTASMENGLIFTPLYTLEYSLPRSQCVHQAKPDPSQKKSVSCLAL